MKDTIRYTNQNQIEIHTKEIPTEVSVIPLRNAVVFPGVLLPIFVGRNESIQLIEKEGKPGAVLGLFAQRSAHDEKIDKQSLYLTGTLAEIHRIIPMSEEGYQVLLQGIHKVRLKQITQRKPYIRATIEPVKEIKNIDQREHKEFQERVVQYIENHPGIPDEVAVFVRRLNNPSSLANHIVFFSQKSIKERIQFLEIERVSEKMEVLTKELIEETNRMRMQKEVQQKVEEDTNKMQKEFYLRKQLETIRKELGETEDDADDLGKQLEKKYLPDYMRKAVNKELKRMQRLQEGPHGGGMETSQIRNWLELVLELPWEAPSKREISLRYAAQILDEDHEGLEDVKKRILEFLAIEKQVGSGKAPILCLVGPPGVGKTSLATSIARALGQPLVRAALGGVRDEAEIRGHRRTYVGALPGKIINAMKKAKASNPVFLLDEIDKTNSSYHGDPSSALLEVLDPEQNNAFEDHYLAEPYDLSQVLFICTANSLDSIPIPLLDRMEVVKLSGYTVAEKYIIAKKHLLPRIIKELKLEKDHISLTKAALKKIITAHTREAGVRHLKRKLEALAHKTVRSMLEEAEKKQNDKRSAGGRARKANKAVKISKMPSMHYDVEDVRRLLGRDRYHQDYKENIDIPGVATGLAWTPTGGDILFIEAATYAGKGQLKLSGQLGDVMKESAQTALSFLRANSKKLHINSKVFANKDIHIHVPSGAIPKDGPSAGVTLLSALSSLFSNRPVAKDIAMSGEISLRGRILPVGGIKEKILAARSAGISIVYLPEKNRAEFEEIPKHVRKGIEARYYDSMLALLQDAVPENAAT